MKSINATVPPTPIPVGTVKQVRDAFRAWQDGRGYERGWRKRSAFTNRQRIEAERRKMEGTK